MKLRKGDKIACSLGHPCGQLVRDVDDGQPVTPYDFEIDCIGQTHLDSTSYVCNACGKAVATLKDQTFRVHVQARGWIS